VRPVARGYEPTAAGRVLRSPRCANTVGFFFSGGARGESSPRCYPPWTPDLVASAVFSRSRNAKPERARHATGHATQHLSFSFAESITDITMPPDIFGMLFAGHPFWLNSVVVGFNTGLLCGLYDAAKRTDQRRLRTKAATATTDPWTSRPPPMHVDAVAHH
jgi:hypothetical protein